MSSLIWGIYLLITRYGPCKKWLPVAFLLTNALLSLSAVPLCYSDGASAGQKDLPQSGEALGANWPTRIELMHRMENHSFPECTCLGLHWLHKICSFNFSPRMNGSPYAVPPFRYICKRPYVGRTQNQKNTTAYHQGQVRADTQQHTIQQLL